MYMSVFKNRKQNKTHLCKKKKKKKKEREDLPATSGVGSGDKTSGVGGWRQ